MRTNKIRLTESQLHSVIKESVSKVLKENEEDAWKELARAKASGDIQEVVNAMHALEAELTANGRLSYGGNLSNGKGCWRSTRDLTKLRDDF